MQADPQIQSYLAAAGLVVAAVFGVVVVWKFAKSLLKLVFWFLALVAVATVAWWLLEQEGLAPPVPGPGPPKALPAKPPVVAARSGDGQADVAGALHAADTVNGTYSPVAGASPPSLANVLPASCRQRRPREVSRGRAWTRSAKGRPLPAGRTAARWRAPPRSAHATRPPPAALAAP